MTRIIPVIIVALAALVRPAHAQAPSPGAEGTQAVTRAGAAAERELAKSIADLNAMRERIAAEKLPMAQELTGLEEKVIELRRESDRVQRLEIGRAHV